ncbi:MAG TPA: hypothetical protein ACHBX0_02460 [Arsenophonus sp.]
MEIGYYLQFPLLVENIMEDYRQMIDKLENQLLAEQKKDNTELKVFEDYMYETQTCLCSN